MRSSCPICIVWGVLTVTFTSILSSRMPPTHIMCFTLDHYLGENPWSARLRSTATQPLRIQYA